MDAVARRRTGVLVIGTGGAGLRAAIAAKDGGADVLLLGKRLRGDAHTVLAAGGINAALGTRDPDDSWQQHFADTVRESYLLADPRVAELMAREAPDAVAELAGWGCRFARTEDGRLDQRFFGAHTYRRTCYAGDHTGRDMVEALVRQVQARGIPVMEHQYVSQLLTDDGACRGALCFDMRTGRRTAVLAAAVVLCAGGHTSLWFCNTSRVDESWGEGMALALRAGCPLMDMELVQFHPTGMVWPEDVSGTLVTEAVRGEGGRLYNALGERFMERYDPDRMELSTRDRVALANYTEIAEGRGGPNGGVFLDISHLGRDLIMEKLPRMYQQFQSFQGLDIASEPMEVAPTAHYSMGGVVVDPETHATTVDGLYAAGECASGLHGANRLGGNSLVDIMVFGRRAGQAAAGSARRSPEPPEPPGVVDAADRELLASVGDGRHPPRTLQLSLRRVMWERCGVLRSREGLRGGLDAVAQLGEAAGDLAVRPHVDGWGELARALDLGAGLITAEATLRGALAREETRGCHNRSDFPGADPALQVNFLIEGGRGTERLSLHGVSVPPIPDGLGAWIEATPDPDHTAGLVE